MWECLTSTLSLLLSNPATQRPSRCLTSALSLLLSNPDTQRPSPCLTSALSLRLPLRSQLMLHPSPLWLNLTPHENITTASSLRATHMKMQCDTHSNTLLNFMDDSGRASNE